MKRHHNSVIIEMEDQYNTAQKNSATIQRSVVKGKIS